MHLKQLMAACYASNLVVSSDILKRAMEEEVTEREKRALGSIRELIKKSQSALKDNVDMLRHYRRKVKEYAELVKKLDHAVQYFLIGGNPLPYLKIMKDDRSIRAFCQSVGMEVPKDDADAYKVPDDFQSSETNEVSE